jgi:hypothetical protein
VADVLEVYSVCSGIPSEASRRRSRKSEMLGALRPSSIASAAAKDVVLGASNGLAGHVPLAPMADAKYMSEVWPGLPRDITDVPRPSSLNQNIKAHTDLIKYGSQNTQTLMATAARIHTRKLRKRYLPIC